MTRLVPTSQMIVGNWHQHSELDEEARIRCVRAGRFDDDNRCADVGTFSYNGHGLAKVNNFKKQHAQDSCAEIRRVF